MRSSLLPKLLNFFLPGSCPLCGRFSQGSSDICCHCREGFPLLPVEHCRVCGIPLNIAYPLVGLEGFRCGLCRIEPPPFDRALAAFLYKESLPRALAAFKYRGKFFIGKEFADLLWNLRGEEIKNFKPHLLCYVPLHKKKALQRGFDQSALLAHQLGSLLKVPVAFDGLVRVKNTESQTHLNRKERGENVKGAFVLDDRRDLEKKRVILVDDVYTTGATIKECCSVLRKGGVGNLLVVTVARA